MNSKVSLSDHIQLLNFITRALGESIEDYGESSSGIPIYYNVDFSLLCPILFDRPSLGSKDFFRSSKDGMRRVLGKVGDEGHYTLVVSGLTIIEFFDQLAHMIYELRFRMEQIPRKYAFKDENILRETLVTSEELRRDLSLLTRQGLDARIRTPINRLLQLLDSGVLRGIGDVLDNKAVRGATDKALFDLFFAEHVEKRLGVDNRARNDSLFHYKIDAANNCLTVAASKLGGMRTLFVTPTPLNLKQCTRGKQVLARLDRTPLFLLNTNRLHERGIIGDELGFLKCAAREACELVRDLRNYRDLHACPTHLQLRLARFYQDYVSLLNRAPREGDDGTEDAVNEIMNVVTDKDAIQRVLDEAVRDIQDGARLIELHKTSFDLPYIEQFDFKDDPILKRIGRDLGVSFRQ